MWHDMGFGGMWFGWIFWVVIVALIIWLIINNSNKTRHNVQEPRETPLDILNRRYANGDISREEYLERKKDLES